MAEIYRGYDIEPVKTGGFVIKKDGVVIGSQPSSEFAYKFIDEERRKLAQRQEQK
jgi:hypothetical protein